MTALARTAARMVVVSILKVLGNDWVILWFVRGVRTETWKSESVDGGGIMAWMRKTMAFYIHFGGIFVSRNPSRATRDSAPASGNGMSPASMSQVSSASKDVFAVLSKLLEPLCRVSQTRPQSSSHR